MGYDHHRPSVTLQILLEPLERTDVQVVRRLVQKQNIRLLQKQYRQSQSGLLSSRQCRNLLIVHGLVKGHACQYAPDFALVHVSAHALIAFADLLILLKRLFIIAGLTFFACLRKKTLHLLLHLREVLEHFIHFLDDGALGVETAVLFKISDLQVRGHEKISPVMRELSRQHSQKRRLAGSVDADDADPLAAVDSEADLVQHQIRTVVFFCQVVCRNNYHIYAKAVLPIVADSVWRPESDHPAPAPCIYSMPRIRS